MTDGLVVCRERPPSAAKGTAERHEQCEWSTDDSDLLLGVVGQLLHALAHPTGVRELVF